jgi:hypothetical protein
MHFNRFSLVATRITPYTLYSQLAELEAIGGLRVQSLELGNTEKEIMAAAPTVILNEVWHSSNGVPTDRREASPLSRLVHRPELQLSL